MKLAFSFCRFFSSAVPKKVFGIWRMYRSLRKLNNFYNIQILFRYSNKVRVIGWAFGTHHRKYEVWVQVFFGGGGESEESKSLKDPELDRKVILKTV